MAEADPSRRAQQKLRTRKDLLQAAAELMRDGRRPASLEEVAEKAMVSRATAYRYFANIEALLLEAELDVAAPAAELVFAGTSDGDPLARLLRVDGAFDAMMAGNERTLRMMLAQSLERSLSDEAGEFPKRQNRRSPLIETALGELPGVASETRAKLAAALALVIGTEAFVVFADVLRMAPEEAGEVRRWAIGALLEKALKG